METCDLNGDRAKKMRNRGGVGEGGNYISTDGLNLINTDSIVKISINFLDRNNQGYTDYKSIQMFVVFLSQSAIFALSSSRDRYCSSQLFIVFELLYTEAA